MVKSNCNFKQTWIKVFFLLFCATTAICTNPNQKIVGGRSTNWRSYQFMASLVMRVNYNQVRLCGGSIIHSRWILTAAHCVEEISAKNINVYIGSTKFAEGIRHSVEQIISHEKYDGENYDIAVLQLQEPVTFGAGQKIGLNSSPVPIGTKATLIGWGQLSTHQNPNDVAPLQSVTLEVTKCQRDAFLKIPGFPVGLIVAMDEDDDDKSTLICTSTRQGKGACVGDSGGPLIAGGKQIGIVSRGSPCATGVPDVYTKVQAFIPWLEKVTRVVFRV